MLFQIHFYSNRHNFNGKRIVFIPKFLLPGPDFNRHARNEEGILSSLDRHVSPDNTI